MAKIDTHLTKELLNAFHSNQLNREDYLKVLEHTAHCTYCASMFAASFEQEKLIKAPNGLKESVLQKAAKITVHQISLPRKVMLKKQMFFYSIKVCAAMCGALLIMVSSMRVDLQKTEFKPTSNTSIHLDFLEGFNTSMQEFSDGLNQQMNSFVNIDDNNDSANEESPNKSNKKSEVK